MSELREEETVSLFKADKRLLKIFSILLVCITALKLIFAIRLDLYSDEIFYWLESTLPALAYSDLPFVTAQLAGLGTRVLGDTPLGVRFSFLALGTSIPILVFWVTVPIKKRRPCAQVSDPMPLLAACWFLGPSCRAGRANCIPWLVVFWPI
jgi:hypothetical protein